MMLTASLIFLITITLVIWQPRGLNIAWSATAGALLALIFGVVGWSDIVAVWEIIWNATLAFVAIILISLLLDQSGFFEWAALHIARFGRGRGRLLFIYMILLGALVSAFFANDGAALILTPIVISMLYRLGLSRASMLAFVMGAGFIADTASLPLVVSNLVNIVSADYFGIPFADYAAVMIPVNIASVIATLAVLMLYFRKDIPKTYDLGLLTAPKEAIKDPIVFWASWPILGLLLVGFFVIEPLGVPISFIALLGAGILLIIARLSNQFSLKPVIIHAPWNIVIFSLGMYLVVYGLRNAGLMDYLVQLLDYVATKGLLIATVATGFIAAILSSIANNLPATLMGALSVDGSQATGIIREAMIYANVIGSDLGPKFTPIGSLATLLWLHVLSQRDLKISWGYYFRVGIVLTTPILLVTLLALVIRLSL